MSVSRALARKPGVSPELREKILRIARELGYRPNPLVKALMTTLRSKSRQPTQTGLVLAFMVRADQSSDVRLEHFRGAQKAADEQGYKLEKFVVGRLGEAPGRLSTILQARGIHGILVAPLAEGQGSYELDWTQFSTVVIEYTFTSPDFDRVVHDNYGAMRLILDQCRARDWRRVGLLFSRNGHERTKGLYEAAYWMEQKSTGDFAAVPPLRVEAWNEPLITRWFERHRPQVVVTSAALADRCEEFLNKRRRNRRETGVLLNVNLARGVGGLGIRQNNELIGATAARLLIDKLNRNDRGIPATPATMLIPGCWQGG